MKHETKDFLVQFRMQIDTPEESFDFLAYELAYSWWICHILDLPTDKEESEQEIANESDH